MRGLTVWDCGYRLVSRTAQQLWDRHRWGAAPVSRSLESAWTWSPERTGGPPGRGIRDRGDNYVRAARRGPSRAGLPGGHAPRQDGRDRPAHARHRVLPAWEQDHRHCTSAGR